MGVRDVWQGIRARWRGNGARPRARFSSGLEGDLARFVDSYLSGQTGAVTREQALSVPALQRGRNLVCSIGTLPLVLNAPDGSRIRSGSVAEGAQRAAFLAQIDPDVTNVVTLAQTIEDLLFYSIAWWEVIDFGPDGFPSHARRCDPSSVSLTPPPGSRRRAPLPSGQDPRGASVYIDGREVPASRVIRFDSPNPAVLTAGARAIRKAILVSRLAAVYAENPRPLDYFHVSDAAQFEDPEDKTIKDFLSKWAGFRQKSSTGWVPKWAKYEQVDNPSPLDMQLVELMKQSGLEIANMLGVDPEELGVSTTSRTYSNVNDRRVDKLNEVLSPYMLAITQRLSMGDVTKPGYSAWFDLDNYLKSNPTERWATYRTAKELGVITPEEIRLKEGWGPMPEELRQAREPIQAEVVDPQAVTDGSGQDGQGEAQPAIAGAKAERAAQWQFRRGGPAVQLARGPEHGSYDFEFEGAGFTFDAETRTVEGLALPYDKQAGKYGYKFRFAKNSLEFGEVSRVKITVDQWDAVGVATYVSSKSDGYHARGRIAKGLKGDELLSLAMDGVYDGMSVGVDFDFDTDTVPDPKFKDDPMARLVQRATLREIAVTAMPAFDDARLTSVKASTNAPEEEVTVPDNDTTTTAPVEPAPVTTPAPAAPVAPAAAEPTATTAPAQFAAPAGSVTLTAEQFSQLLARGAAPAPAAQVEQQPAPAQFAERPVVDPTTRPIPGQQPASGVQVTRNPLAYRFDRRGVVVDETDVDVAEGRHSFGRDLRTMWAYRDEEGKSEAGKRVFAALAAWDKAIRTRFANTASSDVNELFPTKTLDYREAPGFFTPLWQMIDKGTLPNGVQPFIPPTMSKSSTTIAVATHTEGTEPTATKYVTTGDTITPVPLTAKVSMTRVAWDTVTGLDSLAWVEINNQYYKTLDDRAATFLATLTAADNISLDGLTHIALQDLWESAYIHLQQGRRYNFTALALEERLFKAFNAARENSGAGNKLYPRLSPTNAMGTVAERFGSIDLNGVQGIMCAALGTANSWLFDPAYVVGQATPPQRLQFSEGIGTASDGSFAPVAMIDMAVWGYHAEYCWDTDAVKEITYNNAS